jgi:hypothetical protein
MTDEDHMCSNPDCIKGAEMTCADCDKGYCHGHASHPEHQLPN